MPQTRFEKLVFSLMMSAMMVLGMESYNLLLIGASAGHFARALALELPLMTAVVMLTQNCVGGPLALRLASLFGVRPGPSTRSLLVISCCTVVLMCPLMSMWATLFFKLQLGPVSAVWLRTVAMNLPMAFGWQLLIAGPTVRHAFRRLFR